MMLKKHTDSVAWLEADVLTASDYYAFGAPMPRRQWQVSIIDSVSYDSCVSCAALREAMVAYVVEKDSSALSDTTQVQAWLDSTYSISKTWKAYKQSLLNCKVLNIWYAKHYSGTGNNSGYFEIPHDTLYEMDTLDFSIEAWVKIDSSLNDNDRHKAITGSVINSPAGGYMFYFFRKELRFEAYEPGYLARIACTTGIEYNTVYHIGIVKQGKDASNWKLYINGQQVSFIITYNTLSTGDIDPVVASKMGVGGLPDYPTKMPFCGLMRELRVYKRKALSAGEMEAIYSNGCGGPPAMGGLVLWMPLDEGKGQSIYDKSGYGAIGSFSISASTNWYWQLNDSACSDTGTAFCIPLLRAERSGSRYRYAFNGMEKDDEFDVEGGHYDFGARIYDARLGRWLACDPKAKLYPSESSYLYALNNPLYYIDKKGETIKELNQPSAKRLVQSFQNIFKDDDALRSLFTLQEDGMTFRTIDKDEFEAAIKGLSAEKQALARGYFAAINSTHTHKFILEPV